MALWDRAACMQLDRFLAARGVRHSAPTLGQTLGDPLCNGHTRGSMHYPYLPPRCTGPRGSTGQARDFGITYPAPGSDCEAIARALEPLALGRNYLVAELLWTRPNGSGIWCDNGVRYVPMESTRDGHRNHVHAAVRVGAQLPISGPIPPPTPPPSEVDMPIAYVEKCGPGDQVVVALPPIESEFWSAVFVSVASQAQGATIRVAVEPSARILEENRLVPRGRKVVWPMKEGDEALSIVNKGPQPISILVEAK